MIIERAEMAVQPGREEDLMKAMAEGRKFIAGAKGCRAVKFGGGIENPSKAILLVEWDTIESHTAFTQTPEFAELGALLGGFFLEPPSVEHFSCS